MRINEGLKKIPWENHEDSLAYEQLPRKTIYILFCCYYVRRMHSVQQVAVFSTGKTKTKGQNLRSKCSDRVACNRTAPITSKNKQNPGTLQCKTRTCIVCSEHKNLLDEQASLTYSRCTVIQANRINLLLSSGDATLQSPSAAS